MVLSPLSFLYMLLYHLKEVYSQSQGDWKRLQREPFKVEHKKRLRKKREKIGEKKEFLWSHHQRKRGQILYHILYDILLGGIDAYQ